MADSDWHEDSRPKPGEEFATINEKRYPTVLDPHGIQRFQQNRVIRDLLDAASHGDKLDLNMIWLKADSGRYCKDEMHEFYRLIGYSVCGFSDVFDQDEISSSMWKLAKDA